jgi:molybdenum cofactor guanylyltransferase
MRVQSKVFRSDMSTGLASTTLAILTGGESRRMGQPKALMQFEGERLISRLLKRLSPEFGSTILVGNLSIPADLVAPVPALLAPDVLSKRSSLNGVLSALLASPTEWVGIFACDAPYPSIPLLRAMAQELTAANKAVLCADTEGRPQPFHAFWHRDAAEVLQQAAERNELRLADVLAKLPHALLGPAEWRRYDAAGDFLVNLNTSRDVEQSSACKPATSRSPED